MSVLHKCAGDRLRAVFFCGAQDQRITDDKRTVLDYDEGGPHARQCEHEERLRGVGYRAGKAAPCHYSNGCDWGRVKEQ